MDSLSQPLVNDPDAMVCDTCSVVVSGQKRFEVAEVVEEIRARFQPVAMNAASKPEMLMAFAWHGVHLHAVCS